MKSLSAKTFQCGVTVQGLTTLSGTVYLTALTNTATWDYVVVGTTAQGQLYTRTYAQLMSDITSGIGLSGYVPTSRTLTINGVSYDLTANRSWTISTVDYTSRLQHQVKAGVAINKGQAVYVTSADGTNMIVGLASNASEATSSKTMGLLDATVSTNGFANVVTEGLLAGLDTSTAGTEGDPVWLGTGGNLIYGLINKPYAPAHLVFIGIVTRKNSNNGEIFVKVQNGFELNEIHDVDLITTTPVNGHLLGFNGTLWVNKTIAGWLGYTPANASGTTNYISKFTGSSALGNSQIYDDGSNVGIGTTTMYGKLSISSGNSNGIRIDTNGGGYSALNIGGTGSLTVDAPGITGGRFQITDSGNVGIGTPSPSYKLQVNGDGNGLYVLGANSSPYNQIIATFIYGGNGNSINIENQGGKASIQARAGGSTMDLLLNPAGSNVVIGTTTPFTIGGTAKVSIYADAPSTYGLSSTDAVYLRRYGVGEYQFQTTASGGNNGNLSLQSYGGSVGIGTTTPSQKLDVNGYAKFTSGIILDGGATSHYREFIWNTSGFNRWDLYVHGAEPGSNVGGDLFLARYADNGAYLANAVTFQRSTGNVGIGTSSPGYTLDVNGSSAFRNDMYVFSTSTYWYNGTSYFQATNSSDVGILKMTNNTSPIALQPNGGNVGIGTTSPAAKLDILGLVNTSIFRIRQSSGLLTQIESDNGYANLFLYQAGGNPQIGLVSNGSSYFNGGNVGIGTTSPSHNLHLYGAGDRIIKIENTGTYLMYVGLLSNEGYIGSSNATPLGFYTNNVNRIYINTSGNVGIGTTSPAYKFQVAGGDIAIDFNRYLRGGSGGDWNLVNLYNGATGDMEITMLNASWYLRHNANASFAGSVGIGTTSPSQKLHVVGASILANNSSINPDSYSNTVIAGAIGTVGGWALSSAIGGNAGTGHSWAIGTNGDNLYMGYSNGSSSNSMLTFLQVDDNTRNVFLVPSAGNVGIGTASPSYKLDVSGALRATGTVYSDNGSLAGALNLGQVVSIGSSFGSYANLVFTMHNGGGFSDIMKLQGNGYVGIGTTSPTNRLQIGSIGSSGYGGNDLAIGNGTQVMAFYQSATVSTWYTNTSFSLMPSGSGSVGYVGIGTLTPSTLLDVSGVITATGGNSTNWNTAYGWGNHSSAGYVPQARTLTINGTSYDLSANRSWTIATTTPGGSDTQVQYNSSGSLAGASALTYNSTTNRVGINQASPGYDLDVNGQVRVQDKLRIGTGNGVVHMSSSATINPSATTVVWAQTVSVGMCAFIEYYILNNNSLTDQRAGTIMVTWNQSGTPTIAHTETTTPDIGSTTSVNFTSSLVGSDARINAVNSSANPYTIVMSYKYF